MKEKIFERCKKINTWQKKNLSIVMIFSDEKIFTVDAVLNRINDRYNAESRAEVKGTFRTKYSA